MLTKSSSRFAALAASVAVSASVAFGAFSAIPASAATLTSAQIQSIVSLLQSFGADAATIANVQASLNGQPTSGTGSTPTTGGSCSVTWTRSLQQGSTGTDVQTLQKILNMDPDTMVASTGAGSPGSESTYFGPATRAAVVKFQTKRGVSAIGIVGPSTRAALSAYCAGSTGTGTGTNPGTSLGSGLTVMAAAQPANALAPKGAARIPFTNFTVTASNDGDITLNGVTVERRGVSTDASFSGVVLLDASTGLQIGISKTLNSNHQATVGESIVIPRGTSRTFTVAANRVTTSGNAGEIATFAVVAVNTSATVNGSLPIVGASHTINDTLSVGSVSTSTSSFDPGSDQQRNIGDTGVRFSGIRFTAASSEDLKLYSIRWRQTGSASSFDLSNVVTVVNGTSYPTAASADGKYYTATFPGGIMIAKGNSVDAYVQADITGSGAAGRTASFDIDKSTDVYFVGQLYGYGIAAPGTYTPWFDGYSSTINAGTVTTISKANEVAAQNIAVNVSNQVLGGFATNFAGEAVSAQQMVFNFDYSSGSASSNLLTSVSLVDASGRVVAGPVDAVAVAGTQQKVTFTDTVTFPVGRQVYTLKGKVPSTVSNGVTITASTTPSSNWTNVTGQTSGNTISLSGTSQVTMNTVTVKGGSVAVTFSTQPTSQNVVAGVQNFTFANVQIDASQSGEDIRVNSLPVYFQGNTTLLSGCQIWDGSTSLNNGSRVVNSLTGGAATANTFSFDNTLIIPKGTVKTLALSCNLSSSATSSATFRFGNDTTAGDYSFTGATSGNTVTPTVVASNGGTMTVTTGSLAVSVDSSSPSYKVASGGSTGVTVAAVKVRATNEATNLTKLGLTLTNGAAADLSQVYIYNGATLVGTAQFTGSNTTATSTFNSSVALPKDTDVVLTVKADFADIGSSQSGTEGSLVKIDPLNAEGTGASSGNTVTASATAGVAGVRVFNTFPTLALDTLGSTGVADGRLMRFKVTADSMGQVGIGKFAFTIATTSATVTNIGLYAYTDSSYSSPISGQGTSGQVGTTTSSHPAAGTAFVVAPSTSAVQVPAGTTLYFELRGSVAGVQSGSSVVTTLNGDSSASPSDETTPFASVSGNFIWSANATGTAATSTGNDWSNGYGLPGFPASGLIQTRSN